MPVTSEVFFDPSGRRWRRVKRWVLSVFAFSVGLFVVSWAPVRSSPALMGRGRPPPGPDLSGLDSSPLIGTGPLARLVRLKVRAGNVVAVDPLTGETVAALTAAERQAAGRSSYAIYRYGYNEGVHRTISLTFDDGPDPAWTPQILELLSKNKVPATFFVIGAEVVRFPELVDREVREGHTVANHTMTHPELNRSNIGQELVTTDRILAATASVRTGLARLPYDGYGPSGHNTEGELLLESQRLGYIVSIEDFDSNDWKYGGLADRPATPIPLPPSTMDNITILLHDGGGNRSETLAYLTRLIPWARAHGYSFHNLPQVSEQAAARSGRQAPNLWDREALWTFQARWLLPNSLLRLLFWIAAISVVLGGVANIILATGNDLRSRRRLIRAPTDGRGPPVSVVVAAFNEEAVVARCLAAVCRSHYAGLVEILVIDDGSTDDTAEIVTSMSIRDQRIRLIRQANCGKPSALNRAFVEAQGEIVVTIDADTLLTPSTIDHLIRRFVDDGCRLGAVAGTVKVGNVGNLITRWQALEYLIQIGVDRNAQDAVRAIMVVPGACAAWRRDAVLRAGGYSSQTLAEDCDLALQLQELGYRVVQCDRAESFTEAPETFRELSRQRFRWTFGNAQALWKHRSMIFNPRHGCLGLFTLPLAVLSVMLPVIFLPFVYVMAVLTIEGQNGHILMTYGGIFLAVQFAQAAAAVALSRESPRHLLILPVYRLIAEPLRAYLLYRSALTMLRGSESKWHKATRTGTVRVREPASAEVSM